MASALRYSAWLAAAYGLFSCTELAGLNDVRFTDSAGGAGGTTSQGGGGTGGTGGSPTAVAGSGGTAGSGAASTGGGGTGGAGGTGGGPVSAYAQAVLADGPVAYWRLGETSGTVAFDVSGNDYHGIYQGGYTLGLAGLQTGDGDPAVELDGNDALVQGVDVLDFDTATAFSAEAWVRMDSFAPSGSELGVVGKRTQGTFDNGWTLRVAHDGAPWFTVYRDGVHCGVESSTPVLLGVTAHIVGVFDGGTMRIYLNGVETDLATGCQGPLGTTEGLVLGFDPGTGFFDGVLDEVAVYDKVLTHPRIVAHISAAN